MSLLETIAVIVGVVSGVSGLVLGIVTWWDQRVTTRPRIVVRPRMSLYTISEHGPIPATGVLQVHNVGHVSVIGSTVGFLRRRGQDKDHVIGKPVWLSGASWPGELKPQHSVELHFSTGDLPSKLGCAFVKTIVGDTFKASQRDMRRFAKELSQPPPASP